MPAYQNPQRHAASLRCIRNRLRVRRYRTPDTQNNKGLPGESVTATFFYICHTTVGINACKTFGNGMYHETKHRVLNIVVSLLLLSSVIHTGCMYAIASNNGVMKPYDLNVQKKAQKAPEAVFSKMLRPRRRLCRVIRLIFPSGRKDSHSIHGRTVHGIKSNPQHHQ